MTGKKDDGHGEHQQQHQQAGDATVGGGAQIHVVRIVVARHGRVCASGGHLGAHEILEPVRAEPGPGMVDERTRRRAPHFHAGAERTVHLAGTRHVDLLADGGEALHHAAADAGRGAQAADHEHRQQAQSPPPAPAGPGVQDQQAEQHRHQGQQGTATLGQQRPVHAQRHAGAVHEGLDRAAPRAQQLHQRQQGQPQHHGSELDGRGGTAVQAVGPADVQAEVLHDAHDAEGHRGQAETDPHHAHVQARGKHGRDHQVHQHMAGAVERRPAQPVADATGDGEHHHQPGRRHHRPGPAATGPHLAAAGQHPQAEKEQDRRRHHLGPAMHGQRQRQQGQKHDGHLPPQAPHGGRPGVCRRVGTRAGG